MFVCYISSISNDKNEKVHNECKKDTKFNGISEVRLGLECGAKSRICVAHAGPNLYPDDPGSAICFWS